MINSYEGQVSGYNIFNPTPTLTPTPQPAHMILMQGSSQMVWINVAYCILPVILTLLWSDPDTIKDHKSTLDLYLFLMGDRYRHK